MWSHDSHPSCLDGKMFIRGKINHRDIIKWKTLGTSTKADIDVLQMGNQWKTKVLIVKGEIKMNMMIDPQVFVLL